MVTLIGALTLMINAPLMATVFNSSPILFPDPPANNMLFHALAQKLNTVVLLGVLLICFGSVPFYLRFMYLFKSLQ